MSYSAQLASNPPLQLMRDCLAYWGFDNLETQTILQNGVSYTRGIRYNTQGNNPDVGTTLESNKITTLSDYTGWYENNLSAFGSGVQLCDGAPNGTIGYDGPTVTAIFRVTSIYETGYTVDLTVTNAGPEDLERFWGILYCDISETLVKVEDRYSVAIWDYHGPTSNSFDYIDTDEPSPNFWGEDNYSAVNNHGYLLSARHTRIPSGSSIVLKLTFGGGGVLLNAFLPQNKYLYSYGDMARLDVLVPKPGDPDPQPTVWPPFSMAKRPYSGFQGYFFNGPNSYLRNNNNSPKIASIGSGDFTIGFFVAPSGPNGNPIQTVISTEEIGTAYPGYTNVGFSVYLDYTAYDPINDPYRVALGFKVGNFDPGPVCYINTNKANSASEIQGRHGTDNYNIYVRFKISGWGDYSHISIVRNEGKYTVYRNFHKVFECDPTDITGIDVLAAPRITIGGQWINSGAGSLTNLFRGAVDEIGIWKTAMWCGESEIFRNDPVIPDGNLDGLRQIYNYGGEGGDGFNGAREYMDFQYTYPFGYYVYIPDELTDYTVYSYNKLDIPIGLANGYLPQEFYLTDATALINYANRDSRDTDYGMQGIDWAPFTYNAATQTLSGRYNGMALLRDRMSNLFTWFDDNGYGGYNPKTHQSYSFYKNPNFGNVGGPTPRGDFSTWYYDTGPGMSDPYGNAIEYTQEYFARLKDIVASGIDGDKMKTENIDIAYLVYIDTLSTVGMVDPGKIARVQQRLKFNVNVLKGFTEPKINNNFVAGTTIPEIVIDLSDYPRGNIKRAVVNVFNNVGSPYYANPLLVAHMTPTAQTPSTEVLTATISGKKLIISGFIPIYWLLYTFRVGYGPQIKVSIIGEADTPGYEYEIYHVMDTPLPGGPIAQISFSPGYFELNGAPINNTLDIYFNPKLTLSEVNNVIAMLRDIEGINNNQLIYRTFTNNENGDDQPPVVHDEPPDINWGAGTGYSSVLGVPSGLTVTRIPNYSISSIESTPMGTKTNPYILSGVASSGLVFWTKNVTYFELTLLCYIAQAPPRTHNFPTNGETIPLMYRVAYRDFPIKTDINITPIKHVDIVMAPGQPITNNVNIPITITGTLVPGGLISPGVGPYPYLDFSLPNGISIQTTPSYAIVGSYLARHAVYDADGNLLYYTGGGGGDLVIYAQGYNCLVAAPIEFLVDEFEFTPKQTFLNFNERYVPPFVPATNYPGWVERWGTPIGLPPGVSQDPASGLVSGAIRTAGSGTTTFKAIHGQYTVDSYGIPWDMVYSPPRPLYMIFNIPLFEYSTIQILTTDNQWPSGSIGLEIISGSLPDGITIDGQAGTLSGYCTDINYSPQLLVIRFSDDYGDLGTHTYPIFTAVNSLLITPSIQLNYTLGNSTYSKITYSDIPIDRWVYNTQNYAYTGYTNNLLPFEITKEGYIKYTHWTKGDYYNTREFNLFPIGGSTTLFYGTSNDPYFYLAPGEYIQGQGIPPGTQVIDIDYVSTPYHYTLSFPAHPSGIIKTVQAGLGLKVYNKNNVYEVIGEGNFGATPPEFTNGSEQNGTAILRYISSFSEYGDTFLTKYDAIYETLAPPQFKVQQNFSTGGAEITGISHVITYEEKGILLGVIWVVSGGDTLHRLELITPGDTFQERHPENNPDSPVPNTYSIQDIKNLHDIWDSYDIIYRPTVYSLRDLHSIIPGPGAYSTDIFISANGQIIQGSLITYNDPKSINFNVYFTGGSLSNHVLKGLAFDKDDILYVVDSTMNNISKIISHTDPNTGYITREAVVYASGSGVFPLNAPSSIAFDLDSNLYVTNPGNNNILKFPPGGGNTPGLFASNISSTAIACSNGHNTLFVVDKINSKIIEFSTSGEIIKTIYSKTIDTENSFNNPSAITFPKNGLDFIVANSVSTPQIIHVYNNTVYSNTVLITINLDRGLPAITPNQTFSGTINVFLEFIILRDNDNQINSWRLIDINNVNLEISIDPYSGVVSGVPGIAGLFTYLVKATNDQGEDTKEITIDIAGITPTILPGQVFYLFVGNPNNASDAIQYSGTTADSWQIVSIVSGGTPDVTINFLGQFVGATPAAVGTYIVNITATNRSGTSAVTPVTLNILLPYPVVTPGQYVYTATNTNIDYDVAYIGSTPNHWELEIPQNTTLAISNAGKITGKIPYESQFTLAVKASNDSGISEESINIIAVDSPPIITTNQVFSGQINVYFNNAILYSGTANTWSLTEENVLPPGLTLNTSTGVISGTPTTPGIYTNISITVISDKGGRDIRTINIVISNIGSLIQIAQGQVINATGVSAFTFTPTYTGHPNRWDAASLPAWLTINHTTGELTGATTGIAHGNYSYCVYAKDDLGNSSAAFIKIQI